MSIRRASAMEAPVLAALHASGFKESWTTDAFATLLGQPGVIGWLWNDPPAGLLLARAVADEAEILTIAVTPDARRHGGGGVLMDEMLRLLRAGETRRVFLEVAADNTAAQALYRAKGFAPCGRRPGYYSGGVDAVIMERVL